MNKEAKEALRLFQCEQNRLIEETFAQVLSEDEKVRLFFIHEHQAFTDGRNIVVDPGMSDVFADTTALQRAEDFMQIEHRISADPWHAMKMIVRGQNIHECLHLLYTNFPPDAMKDTRSTTKVRQTTLALIANIIEDAFIEAAGCSVFDNLEFFLMFERVAVLFSNTPAEGTIDRAFAKTAGADEPAKPEENPCESLTEFLNYMGTFLLYPMVIQKDPSEGIAPYVEETKQLFLDGSVCGDPDQRFTYSQRIFDIIEPLIPETDDGFDLESFKNMLPGFKSHSEEAAGLANIQKKGKTAVVTRRLFSGLDGEPLPNKDFSAQLQVLVDGYEEEKENTLEVLLLQPKTVEWDGKQFDAHAMHHGISIIETKPTPNLNLKKAYQNIYNKYRIHINTYNSRFTQLLQARIAVREEKKLFGSGISSRHLGDTKKRYWYKNGEELGIPELSVLLMIDGSGSMYGPRRENAMIASVILHEVLAHQGISHAIVEHRAIYGEPEVEHNILVDFHGKADEKYNILALEADEGTREGLSLFWAERYISQKGQSGERLIIVLSDGVPAHDTEDGLDYYPPVSTKDTANAAAKITKRGTKIIAVALDENEDGCYEELEKIYPTVIACTDLPRLPAQLLGIISKQLEA